MTGNATQDPPRNDSWRLFDRIAARYDRANRILSWGQDRSWRKKIATLLPKGKLSVLDVATGTGDQLIALFSAQKQQIEKAVGLDLSEEMLSLARKKLAGTPTTLLVADAERLPFAPETFDIATISFGIRNIPSPLRALSEMHRVLKPRGQVFILEFSLPPFPIRPFHLFYLRHLLPRIGGWLSGNVAAYRYLNQTIETFPYGEAFLRLMRSAGFSSLQSHSLMFGAVSLYVGTKR